MGEEWRIVEDDLQGGAVRQLVALHAASMLAASPPGSCHFLDVDELAGPGVTFWSAWVGDELAGCGALKELDPQHGELKSMRTAPSHLRRGVATALLRHLLEESTRRGHTRVSLETGSGPAFAAAASLYARHGFVRCGPYADYADDPHSVFMTLDLTTGPAGARRLGHGS